MKSLAGILLLFVTTALFAQQPKATQPAQLSNIYAGGVSFNNAGTPSIAGTALYAHSVSDGSGTYAFTVVDALPSSYKPFTVTTNVSAGVAQKLFSVGKYTVYVPTSAGVSFNGTNTGWGWSTGGAVPIKLKGSWLIVAQARVLKSSVSNGTGYQFVPGILFGWGK